jgi:hypothetical protein
MKALKLLRQLVEGVVATRQVTTRTAPKGREGS